MGKGSFHHDARTAVQSTVWANQMPVDNRESVGVHGGEFHSYYYAVSTAAWSEWLRIGLADSNLRKFLYGYRYSIHVPP